MNRSSGALHPEHVRRSCPSPLSMQHHPGAPITKEEDLSHLTRQRLGEVLGSLSLAGAGGSLGGATQCEVDGAHQSAVAPTGRQREGRGGEGRGVTQYQNKGWTTTILSSSDDALQALGTQKPPPIPPALTCLSAG